MELTIERYHPGLCADWDSAVAASRNGTFQHMRRYMDYHSDRFADHSLIARCGARILALLPAHATGGTLSSHSGLSYAGWLLSPRADQLAVMALWEQFMDYCRCEGFDKVIYKPSPHIYHRFPCEEDLYALWRAGGSVGARLASSVCPVAAASEPPFDMACRQSARKALAAGITVQACDDYAAFWQILAARLDSRYGAAPVHTLGEIELLHSRFPDNIRLYAATDAAGEMLAGIVMYVSATVGHSQYTAATDSGIRMRTIPALYKKIYADLAAEGIPWLDYGTSNTDGGHGLNEGLIRQKAGFGARTVTYDTYLVDVGS